MPVRRAGARISASFDRLPIRVRLAGVSALLTFVILCAFAVAIGSLTVHRIRSDFNREVDSTRATQLPSQLNINVNPRDLSDRSDRTAARRTSPRRPSTPVHQDPHARRGAVVAQAPARARPSLGPPQRTPHDGQRLPRRQPHRRSSASRQRRADRPGLSSSTAAASPTPRRRSRASSCSCCSACSPAPGWRCSRGWRSRAGRWRRSPSSPRPPRRSRAPAIPPAACPSPQADDEVAELARTLEGMLRRAGRGARRRPRRCSPASAGSSPTPRTSCARR